MVKTIDLETHFVTQEWVEAMYNNKGYPRLADDSQARPTPPLRRLDR